MPDFKFWNPEAAFRLMKARDYPEVARRTIKEMHRQVGVLTLDEHGLAVRGLLVRHLVMPNDLAGTREISRWLVTELSPDTYVNVMAQYHPAGDVLNPARAGRYTDIARPVAAEEFPTAMSDARAAGLHRFDR